MISHSSPFMFESKIGSIESHHPTTGLADGRGHPDLSQAEYPQDQGGDCLRASVAAVAAREPASPHITPSSSAGWQYFTLMYHRLTDSPLGDAMGLACIILTLIIFLFVTP